MGCTTYVQIQHWPDGTFSTGSVFTKIEIGGILAEWRTLANGARFTCKDTEYFFYNGYIYEDGDIPKVARYFQKKFQAALDDIRKDRVKSLQMELDGLSSHSPQRAVVVPVTF